jgi:hypothetical protein
MQLGLNDIVPQSLHRFVGWDMRNHFMAEKVVDRFELVLPRDRELIRQLAVVYVLEGRTKPPEAVEAGLGPTVKLGLAPGSRTEAGNSERQGRSRDATTPWVTGRARGGGNGRPAILRSPTRPFRSSRKHRKWPNR